MIPSAEHARRRHAVFERLHGPILLMGNGLRDRNLPGYGLPFRQDSNFLYLTGCALPDAAALLEDGRFSLFLPVRDLDDALWHGERPSLTEIRDNLGADEVRDVRELATHVRGRPVRTVAVADANKNRLASEWTGAHLQFGSHPGDFELIDTLIDLRRTKSEAEIVELREAGHHTGVAFEAVMRATRPGGHERSLTALFHAVLAARGLTTGYDTILTQSGEILHHHGHDHPLRDGRLLLVDGGGELPSGYGVDITRTWPVSGRFSPQQRAAYDAVLAAQEAAIASIRVGVRYREVHDASSREIARFLLDEGLARGSVDSVVDLGAHALFYPHGVGHHLGLDVHDLEAWGDRASYPPDRGRSEQFGTRNLRLDLPLGLHWVVTVEPGFYVIPSLLRDATLRERFAGIVNFERAAEWFGFGGIRIEDDVRVTSSAAELLTSVPKTVPDIEDWIGTATGAEERLCLGP